MIDHPKCPCCKRLMPGYFRPSYRERISKMIELRKRGLTYGQIALKTGETKNAVAGMLWRAAQRGEIPVWRRAA